MALPTNSWIKIDGAKINTNGAYIGTWEHVIKAAIASGEPVWLRLQDGLGSHSVLVTAHSKVNSFVAFADQEELGYEVTDSEREPRTNFAAFIDRFVPRDSEHWKVVEQLGLNEEVNALED